MRVLVLLLATLAVGCDSAPDAPPVPIQPPELVGAWAQAGDENATYIVTSTDQTFAHYDRQPTVTVEQSAFDLPPIIHTEDLQVDAFGFQLAAQSYVGTRDPDTPGAWLSIRQSSSDLSVSLSFILEGSVYLFYSSGYVPRDQIQVSRSGFHISSLTLEDRSELRPPIAVTVTGTFATTPLPANTPTEIYRTRSRGELSGFRQAVREIDADGVYRNYNWNTIYRRVETGTWGVVGDELQFRNDTGAWPETGDDVSYQAWPDSLRFTYPVSGCTGNCGNVRLNGPLPDDFVSVSTRRTVILLAAEPVGRP